MKNSAAIHFIFLLAGIASLFTSCKKPEDNGNQIWTTEERIYFTEVLSLQDQADQKFDVWLKTMDSLAAVEKMKQFFESDQNVTFAKVTSQGIAVQYSNGIRGGIFLDPRQGPGNHLDSKNTGYKAYYGESGIQTVVNNKKMIVIDAANEDFRLWTNDVFSSYGINLPRVKFSLEKVYKDAEATLERYTQLSGFGIIDLESHGESWPESDGSMVAYMLTGESPGLNTMKYWGDLTNGNVLIMRYRNTRKSVNKYWISEKFISRYNDFSKDTVIMIGNFCYSYQGKWQELQKTFASGAYVGYTEAVLVEKSAEWSINLIDCLTDTTNSPLMNLGDWMKDPEYPKEYYSDFLMAEVHIEFTGDSTLTLLPDTTTTVKDIDGNVYHVKKIGKQYWTVENLKTTRLNDGTAISNVTNSSSWSKLSSMAYCWYNHDPVKNIDYGTLYNWYAVDTKKLAPRGWHVPTLADWNQMIDFLGGPGYAGSKLKEKGTKHWKSPNDKATNSSGFTGLPGGTIYSELWNNIYFNSMGSAGYFWSSTAFDTQFIHYFELLDSYELVQWGQMYKELGMSVRCVRDK